MREKVKLLLYADILYRNLKDFTPQLLELINEFSKVAGYRLTQRNPLHFFTLIVKYQKGKSYFWSPFKISPKQRKYPGINLTKGVKDVYVDNCKTLIQEI